MTSVRDGDCDRPETQRHDRNSDEHPESETTTLSTCRLFDRSEVSLAASFYTEPGH